MITSEIGDLKNQDFRKKINNLVYHGVFIFLQFCGFTRKPYNMGFIQ